jgi:tripartite-type tricarboxylate transporter receptor subunit TctC
LSRRLAAAFLALCVLAISAGASAQVWPTKPLRLIVGYPPGGFTDVLARKIQGPLSAALGQPVVVENKAGAAGIIAMEAIARSNDDHTIGMMTLQNIAVPATGATVPYDPRKDLVGVGILAYSPSVLVVNDTVPIKDVPALIAYAKKHPGELMAATTGNGTGQHFAVEKLKLGAGVNIGVVPYKGAAPAFTDLIGGRVHMMFGTYGSMRPNWESGKVRVIAVTTPKRTPLLPNVPTMAEVSGIPDFNLVEWFAVIAPVSMSKPAQAKLNAALNDIMKTPDYAEFAAKSGIEFAPISADETQSFLMKELDRLTVLSKAARITID